MPLITEIDHLSGYAFQKIRYKFYLKVQSHRSSTSLIKPPRYIILAIKIWGLL